MLRSNWKHSIGAKIFGAFLLMGLIVAALGSYGYGVLNAAGRMVVGTFDGPLMAISYGGAAHVDFVRMQALELERKLAPADRLADIDLQIDELAMTFSDDLDVALERSTADDQRAIIGKIRKSMAQWSGLRARGSDTNAVEAEITRQFDLLIELNADHSFVERRKSVWAISYYEYATIGVTVLALLLACGVTLFLARRIVRPLESAASVADRIASGELQTPIPRGGRDETGTLLNSMTVMQDNIRDMVLREKQRAQSAEMRLLDALENSGEGMLLLGPDARIVIANSEVGSFFPALKGPSAFGMEFKQMLERIESELEPEEIPVPLTEQLPFDSASASAERRLKDGRWLRFAASRTTEGGQIVLISDFTEIKQREEEFKRAKIEAEAANAAKSRFLANMSHELRTPLNAIIGFSEVITGQMFGPLGSERYIEYSTDVLRSGRHLLDVINSVLDLAKSETGRMELKPELVDLRYILMDAFKMMRDQCFLAGLTFRTPPLLHDLPISGEKAKLRQIFLNVMSNAVKFTEKGGVVSVAVESDQQGHIVVAISDTGIGMTQEGIRVALTPFSQVDNRLERKYEGTGLGLPLSKAFIELHDGTMDILSEPGRGTTVRLTFVRADLNADNGEHDIVMVG